MGTPYYIPPTETNLGGTQSSTGAAGVTVRPGARQVTGPTPDSGRVDPFRDLFQPHQALQQQAYMQQQAQNNLYMGQLTGRAPSAAQALQDQQLDDLLSQQYAAQVAKGMYSPVAQAGARQGLGVVNTQGMARGQETARAMQGLMQSQFDTRALELQRQQKLRQMALDRTMGQLQYYQGLQNSMGNYQSLLKNNQMQKDFERKKTQDALVSGYIDAIGSVGGAAGGGG